MAWSLRLWTYKEFPPSVEKWVVWDLNELLYIFLSFGNMTTTHVFIRALSEKIKFILLTRRAYIGSYMHKLSSKEDFDALSTFKCAACCFVFNQKRPLQLKKFMMKLDTYYAFSSFTFKLYERSIVFVVTFVFNVI